MAKRIITYGEAIREALDQSMKNDDSVFIIGEGVPDPGKIFGTTKGLEKYKNRVFDMPTSENGITGMCIGAALNGLRPVMVNQRIDFTLLCADQIINNAAKWHYMFGGQKSIPLVIRMVIGRGWGQGAQHSQNLQAIYSHIPGLKVIMPSTAYDAKGLLISSIKDNNPVIFIEHRWLHNIQGEVPEKMYEVPIGKCNIVKEGTDLTIVATSYMTLEARKAMESLEKAGISAELIDVRTLKPLDESTIINSVKKTGKLLVLDLGYYTGGFAGEIISRVSEKAFDKLNSPPQRITLPDLPTPSTPGLTKYYYPTHIDIVKKVFQMLNKEKELKKLTFKKTSELPHDVPDKTFTGPF